MRHLHVIPVLGLIITICGTERPVPGLPSTRLSPLACLTLEEAATKAFEDIVDGPADEPAQEINEEVACVPLAITLIGTLAYEQSTTQLLESWRKR